MTENIKKILIKNSDWTLRAHYNEFVRKEEDRYAMSSHDRDLYDKWIKTLSLKEIIKIIEKEARKERKKELKRERERKAEKLEEEKKANAQEKRIKRIGKLDEKVKKLFVESLTFRLDEIYKKLDFDDENSSPREVKEKIEEVISIIE